MAQRAKLTAGSNWSQFLGGLPSRPVTGTRANLRDSTDEQVANILRKRLNAHQKAMVKGDVRAIEVGLGDTMKMLRRTKYLPGYEQRKAAVARVVTWLAEQQQR